mmetsp:Transcript_143542/g.248477  ORF Transcript_143542/g.248477 Transcript_143542/m.248477 type:complete len:299 (-) Transcript_143542:55-951(-)
MWWGSPEGEQPTEASKQRASATSSSRADPYRAPGREIQDRNRDKQTDTLKAQVDEYVQDHFYALQATINGLEKRVDELDTLANRQQSKVDEVLQQMKTLIELQSSEVRRGRARDAEIKAMSQQYKDLTEVRMKDQGQQLEHLLAEVDSMQKKLSDKQGGIHLLLQEELTKRDDVVYRIEAAMNDMKTSVTSIRLEVQKHQRSIDFKNVQEYIKLIKAVDEKPDARKTMLRNLQIQEEKLRGAVARSDTDIRTLEESMKYSDKAAHPSKGPRTGGDPLELVQESNSKHKQGGLLGLTNV